MQLYAYLVQNFTHFNSRLPEAVKIIWTVKITLFASCTIAQEFYIVCKNIPQAGKNVNI